MFQRSNLINIFVNFLVLNAEHHFGPGPIVQYMSLHCRFFCLIKFLSVRELLYCSTAVYAQARVSNRHNIIYYYYYCTCTYYTLYLYPTSTYSYTHVYIASCSTRNTEVINGGGRV